MIHLIQFLLGQIPVVDPSDPTTIITGLKWAYATGGWQLLIAFTVFILINLLRTDKVQSLSFLPDYLRWDNLKQWVKYSLTFVGSGLGAGILVLVAGKGWIAFLTSTAVAGVMALLSNKTAKVAGKIEMAVSSTAKDPNYVASPMRNALSLVVPIPQIKDGKLEVPKDLPSLPKP